MIHNHRHHDTEVVLVVVSLSWHMHNAICMEWFIPLQAHARPMDIWNAHFGLGPCLNELRNVTRGLYSLCPDAHSMPVLQGCLSVYIIISLTKLYLGILVVTGQRTTRLVHGTVDWSMHWSFVSTATGRSLQCFYGPSVHKKPLPHNWCAAANAYLSDSIWHWLQRLPFMIMLI